MNNNTRHRYNQTTNKSQSLAVANSNPRDKKNKHGKVGRGDRHNTK